MKPPIGCDVFILKPIVPSPVIISVEEVCWSRIPVKKPTPPITNCVIPNQKVFDCNKLFIYLIIPFANSIVKQFF